MKTSPKHLLSLAGLLCLAVPFLRAADEPAAPAPGEPPKHERREHGPGGPGGPGAMMDRAAKELDLTADQQAKWKEIGQQERAALEPLRADTSLSKDDKRAKAMEINKGFADQRRALLTPEQQVKFDDLRAKMRERGGKRGPQDGGPQKPKSD
jgi:Spy/CpxP family protein refolding chaperone